MESGVDIAAYLRLEPTGFIFTGKNPKDRYGEFPVDLRTWYPYIDDKWFGDNGCGYGDAVGTGINLLYDSLERREVEVCAGRGDITTNVETLPCYNRSGSASCEDSNMMYDNFFYEDSMMAKMFSNVRSINDCYVWPELIQGRRLLIRHILGDVMEVGILRPDNVIKVKYISFALTADEMFYCVFSRSEENMRMGAKMLKSFPNMEVADEEQVKCYAQERVRLFKQRFPEYHTPYLVADLYEFHYYLTLSCEPGRQEFMQRHQLSMEDEATVEELILLAKDEYEPEVMAELEKAYRRR